MKPKAVFFDYMGTCLDWHTGVVASFPEALAKAKKTEIALAWRQQYFVEVRARFHQGLPVENVDDTFRRALDITLERYIDDSGDFTPAVRERAVQAWHNMRAWPEVPEALRKLREELGCELYVHANGSTRLQLDLTRSAGLNWDMLFSSELVGLYKPATEAYLKVLQLTRLDPEECVMVAAHAYDCRGGKAVGLKTVYVKRWTDDIEEDVKVVERENDAFLEDMTDLVATIAQL